MSFLWEQAVKTKPCPNCNGTGRVLDDAAFGQKMRYLRERKEVTLRALAKAMGISAPYLSDLELGRRHWHENIVSHYKVTLEEVK